jgi:hypothetical protein
LWIKDYFYPKNSRPTLGGKSGGGVSCCYEMDEIFLWVSERLVPWRRFLLIRDDLGAKIAGQGPDVSAFDLLVFDDVSYAGWRLRLGFGQGRWGLSGEYRLFRGGVGGHRRFLPPR